MNFNFSVQDQHLKLELTRPMKHSPPYSQEKPYSPVISQLPANGIPNNFAEYIAVTPVALAMHSANGTLDSGWSFILFPLFPSYNGKNIHQIRRKI